MFDVESTLSEMKMANDFYRKIMIFIVEVVKHAVKSNEKAWPIYTKFGDDETKLFDIMDALKAEFSMKCSFENQRRASRFGNVTMGECKCKTIDQFISFLYNERRWLSDTLGILKSEEEMLGALQVGLLEVDPKATEFLLHQSEVATDIDFEEIVNKLKTSKKSYEYLGLAASDPTSYGKMSSEKRRHNSNFKSNNHGNKHNNIGPFNAKKYNGPPRPFFLPASERYKYVSKTCNECGVLGHLSYHHFTPSGGVPKAVTSGVGGVKFPVKHHSGGKSGGNNPIINKFQKKHMEYRAHQQSASMVTSLTREIQSLKSILGQNAEATVGSVQSPTVQRGARALAVQQPTSRVVQTTVGCKFCDGDHPTNRCRSRKAQRVQYFNSHANIAMLPDDGNSDFSALVMDCGDVAVPCVKKDVVDVKFGGSFSEQVKNEYEGYVNSLQSRNFEFFSEVRLKMLIRELEVEPDICCSSESAAMVAGENQVNVEYQHYQKCLETSNFTKYSEDELYDLMAAMRRRYLNLLLSLMDATW